MSKFPRPSYNPESVHVLGMLSAKENRTRAPKTTKVQRLRAINAARKAERDAADKEVSTP